MENHTAYVEANYGNDATAQVENRRSPFKTIQAAIDACQALSPSSTDVYTVEIRPGFYNEDLTMYDYVNVKGAGDNYDTNIQGTVTFGAGVSATSELISCNITTSNAPCVVVNCASPDAYASVGQAWMQALQPSFSWHRLVRPLPDDVRR